MKLQQTRSEVHLRRLSVETRRSTYLITVRVLVLTQQALCQTDEMLNQIKLSCRSSCSVCRSGVSVGPEDGSDRTCPVLDELNLQWLSKFHLQAPDQMNLPPPPPDVWTHDFTQNLRQNQLRAAPPKLNLDQSSFWRHHVCPLCVGLSPGVTVGCVSVNFSNYGRNEKLMRECSR